MQIYRNNHRAALLAALAATYPVIARLGGEDWFAQCAAQYLQRFPSRCGDLQFAGDRFAQFLAAGVANTDYAYFADVARLEWAYQEVLTAAEQAPLDPASLDRARGKTTMAVGGLPFYAGAAPGGVTLSDFCDLAGESTAADPEAPAVRLDAGGSRVLVIRRDDHVELRACSGECRVARAVLAR
jgi:hypothetical protein